MPQTPPVLTADELHDRLAALPGWEGDRESVRRTVQAPDFPSAVRVVDEVAVAAERMNHHPDIDIRWRAVTFVLSTHSAGGVTDLDIELAGRISAIAASHSAV